MSEQYSARVGPLRVVSLFSGGGFAEEALRLASERTGIATEVVMAVDSWEPAARVRDANVGGVRTTIASVKNMTRADLPPHDLVIGGPPCQPWSIAGKRAGADDPRDCLPDFVRLRGDSWLMENVTSRLLERMGGGWSEKFCAADFGDVTSRKRWFYSSHILHVIPTPGTRRVGDIRDHEADRIARDRRADVARKIEIETTRQGRVYTFPIREDSDFIGSLGSTSDHRIQSGSTLIRIGDYRESMMRAKERGYNPTTATEDGFFATLGGGAWHQHASGACMVEVPALKVGLRGHSASASAFEDDEVLGSLVSNSWHGNEISRLGPGVRCPSLLEMARAHSIPDSWDLSVVTKTQRGQIIANGWPIGLGVGVLTAMLRNLR